MPNESRGICEPGVYLLPIVGWGHKLADGGGTYTWWIHPLLAYSCTRIVITYPWWMHLYLDGCRLQVQKKGPNRWGLRSYSIQDTWTGLIWAMAPYLSEDSSTIDTLQVCMVSYESLGFLHCQTLCIVALQTLWHCISSVQIQIEHKYNDFGDASSGCSFTIVKGSL